MRNASPIAAGLPNEAVDLGGIGEVVAPGEAEHDDDLDEERRRRDDGRRAQERRPARPRSVGAPAEVRDDEEEHHHHRARVDEHLRRGEELRREEQEQHRERREVPDERQRRVERVRHRHDENASTDARAGGDEPDDPHQDVSHQLCVLKAGSGVSKRAGSATGTRLIGSASSMSFV